MSSPGLECARVFFLERLELAGKSPLTVDSYRRHLRQLEGWLRQDDKPLTVEEIEPSHVRGFLLHLSRRRKRPGFQHRSQPQGGLAPETLRAYYTSLSAFFSWAEAEGLLNSHQPMRNVQRPKAGHKEIRTLSDRQIRRFLALLDSPHIKKQTLYVAFSLMYHLGLRMSEVCAARLSDFDLKQGALLVRGKGRRESRMPLRNRSEEILQAYMEAVRPTVAEGPHRLLVSYVGKPLRPGPLRKSLARCAERLGVVGTPHVLRHEFATRAIRSGVSAFVLMKLLGHASV